MSLNISTLRKIRSFNQNSKYYWLQLIFQRFWKIVAAKLQISVNSSTSIVHFDFLPTRFCDQLFPFGVPSDSFSGGVVSISEAFAFFVMVRWKILDLFFFAASCLSSSRWRASFASLIRGQSDVACTSRESDTMVQLLPRIQENHVFVSKLRETWPIWYLCEWRVRVHDVYVLLPFLHCPPHFPEMNRKSFMLAKLKNKNEQK